jgi:hypothetical protein
MPGNFVTSERDVQAFDNIDSTEVDTSDIPSPD